MPVVAHLAKTQAIAGTENHLFQLLPALAAAGWGVHLVSLIDRAQGEATPAFEAALQRLPSHGVQVSRLTVRGKADPLGAVHVARALRTIRPDLVHTHMPYADLFGALGARIAGHTGILSSRHRDYSTSPEEVRYFRRYYRLANVLHMRVIAISHRIATLCRSEERRDPSTIDVVWYGCTDQAAGIDRAQARLWIRGSCGLPADAPLVGTVGRLIPLKGHRYALDALAATADRLPELVWLFVGAGPEREPLEELARSRGVASRVRFLGHRDDVPQILAGLDALVHPTLAEGFGLGVLEAMVHGLPVIATRTGALTETVVDGVTGVLVPPRDSQALGDAILSLMADRDRRDHLGREGRARYEQHFRVERMVRETLDVYEQALAAR